MSMIEWLFQKPGQYDADMVGGAEAEAAGTTAGEDQQVLKLRVGDVVGYEGTDYIIEQKIIYASGGYYWYSYHLVDKATGKETWLSAEYDDELEVSIDSEIELDMPKQVPATIRCQNKNYRRTEHGRAEVTVWNAGSTRPVNTRVEYWDFEGPGEESLGVEQWDGEMEVWLSQSIEPYVLTIYPRQVPSKGS